MAYMRADGRYRIGSYSLSIYGKPKHVKNILHYLQKAHAKYFNGDTNSIDAVVDWLNLEFTDEQIRNAHRTVNEGYATGEYHKRGRPHMSRNRNKPAPSPSVSAELAQMQALAAELSQLAETRANGHDAAPTVTSIVDIDTSQFVTKAIFNSREIENAKQLAATHKEIAAIVSQLSAITENKPTIIHIQPAGDKPIIDMGLQHMNFADLVTCLQARQDNGLPLNAWLYGPAGTGKSKACEAAITAFGKKFFGNGKTLDKIELMGYLDGYGKYHRTQFREAFEHGHGYCADEIDSWSPEATTALQGALAGDWAAFPDGMIKRHPEFIFIAAGNTTGKGATIEYVGRMQQDAAFLDRFVFQDWPHDNGLEDALVSNKDWLTYVRKVRAKLAQNNDIRNHLITMRASIHGAALLKAGMAWGKTVNMCLRKGLPQNNWDKIK